jgi:hypothetical protein
MAQPYELLTVEQRQAERATRARKREALQLELGVRGGEAAIESVLEPKDVVEGMTDEEAKRWRAFLKKRKHSDM